MKTSTYKSAATTLNEFVMLSKTIRFGLTTSPQSSVKRLEKVNEFFKK